MSHMRGGGLEAPGYDCGDGAPWPGASPGRGVAGMLDNLLTT